MGTVTGVPNVQGTPATVLKPFLNPFLNPSILRWLSAIWAPNPVIRMPHILKTQDKGPEIGFRLALQVPVIDYLFITKSFRRSDLYFCREIDTSWV